MSLNQDIQNLVEAAESLSLDVTDLVEQMQQLDEATATKLREYQSRKREAKLVLEQAVGAKQQAISIGRSLADFGDRYTELRTVYIRLFHRLHADSPPNLRDTLQAVRARMQETRKLLLAWGCDETPNEKEQNNAQS